MSGSKIIETLEFDLSGEGAIYFARRVIQTMPCEWEGCPIILNSWVTLAKHLQRHCSHVSHQDGVYQCLYSRCSGRTHHSIGGLKTHVELSHLSRVALPCPARGCNEAFVRASQLEGHFKHAHRDLHDKRISPDALAPLAIIAPPRPLHPPPTLPNTKTGMHVVLTSVAKAPVRPGGSQASGSQAISRKWSRLDVQDGETNDDPIPFDDLPSRPTSFKTPNPTLVNIEVRSPPSATTQSLLSRPQPVIHPPIRSHDVQQTILYPVFARKVDMGEA
ncbi:hypothetical protein PAXRUDRAFT_821320 [Paxillus rubicundulus Ve08.2h10]|uniref:C2H2-type domain-containing protein n=1 Tax=Paxillus rubicundulus Ve08.2h10 TaxID=930991 RepID=A0A0D0E6N5_9AGAM|nr:hypothetical protein PAXRUDRAFT_821320 [Paxillus rubicundulus Ve08.2h10]